MEPEVSLPHLQVPTTFPYPWCMLHKYNNTMETNSEAQNENCH